MAFALLLIPAACGSGPDDAAEVASLDRDAASSDGPTTKEPMTEEEILQANRDFAACMREHGVDMPDPEVRADGAVAAVAGAVAVGTDGVGNDSAVMEEATAACGDILKDVTSQLGEMDPEDEARMLEQTRAFSKCMREHGIDMPDPQQREGGGFTMSLTGDIDPTSDAFQEAQSACRTEGEPMIAGVAGQGPVTRLPRGRPGDRLQWRHAMRRGLAATAAGALVLGGLAAGNWPHGHAVADAAATTTPSGVATAEVTRRDLVERLSQSGVLGYGETTALRGSGTGMVTSAPATGAVLRRGDIAYALDGAPIQLFAGTVPFWRDLVAGDEGDDVAQLEANLVALGHATEAELRGDARFDAATTRAVKRWQKALGHDQTGTFERARVVVAPDAVRVAKVTTPVGTSAAPGGSVLEVTGLQRVVTMKIDAARQRLVKPGDAVQVDIPGGTSTAGRIRDVGRVAVDDSGNGQGSAKLTVIVTLDDPDAGATLDQAPVTVKITKSTAKGVLAVPVQALLALAEGGFAVEVPQATGTRLVKVELGAFADSHVEIRGDIAAGDTVVVAK